jgi:hypothetical protein
MQGVITHLGFHDAAAFNLPQIILFERHACDWCVIVLWVGVIVSVSRRTRACVCVACASGKGECVLQQVPVSRKSFCMCASSAPVDTKSRMISAHPIAGAASSAPSAVRSATCSKPAPSKKRLAIAW